MAQSVLTPAKPSILSWPKRMLEHRTYSEWFWGYTFVLPFVLLFGFFSLVPLVWGVVISFQDFTAFKAEHDFVGLRNYIEAFEDPLTWHCLKVTAIYTVTTLPFNVLWPFIVAVIIQQLFPRVRGFFRGAFYLPGVLSGVVITMVWVWIFHPMAGGLANTLLGFFGVERQLWFGDKNLALPALIMVDWMTGWGGGIILFSAAMGGIPRNLYEAAHLDCAPALTVFRRITWPLVRPTTLFVLVTATIGSFQVFQSAFVATKGGPQLATTTFVYRIWSTAFEQLQLGKGAALSIILTIVVMAVAIVQFKYMSTHVEY